MQAKDYRADIDVLRAVAVLSVIFYHFRIPFFDGGYVGVSIFFVISGYLITGIIKSKIENNTFSFLEFYENRIRRILPALLAVIFTGMALCAVFYDRESFYLFQKIAKRAVIGFSNFYFYGNTNYFDPAAETLLLLHTWSLAVEEQFYLLIPALIWLVSKYRPYYVVRVLCFLAVLSFAAALFLVFFNQKFTFYMLPTRAWELLMGAVLAYKGWTPAGQREKVLCVIGGLLLMLGSVVFYGDNLYPGFWAFFPCLGACLYIAGGKNIASSILEYITKNKILVFIGVISYSLYLWHWIILLFYRHVDVTPQSSAAEISAVLAVVFVMSAFSWKFIEQPVRRCTFFKKKKVVWGFAVLSMGTVMFVTSEFRHNYISLTYALTSPATFTEFSNYGQEKEVDFLLVGDSHSECLKNLFDLLSNQYNVVGIYNKQYKLKDATDDAGYVAEMNNTSECYKTHKIKNVFIVFRFMLHFTGKQTYYNSLEPYRSFVYIPEPRLSPERAMEKSIRSMISEAKEHGVENIYIQLPVPEGKMSIPQKTAVLSYCYGYDEDRINQILGENREEYEKRTAVVRGILEKIQREISNVYLVDVAPYFYDSRLDRYLCLDKDSLYYYDDDHFSVEGTMKIRKAYEEIFAKIAAEKLKR